MVKIIAELRPSSLCAPDPVLGAGQAAPQRQGVVGNDSIPARQVSWDCRYGASKRRSTATTAGSSGSGLDRLGRNPRARRQFRQMRDAADSELDRRGLLWPDP